MGNTETSEKVTKEQLLEVLAKLLPTPALAEQMVASIHPDNYDKSDELLVKAIQQIIDLKRGLGASTTSELIKWVEAMMGVGVANAIGFAKHILDTLEDNPEALAKLVKKIAKVAMRHMEGESHEEGVKMMIADPKTALFLWGFFNEGIKQGIACGWRMHELALIEQTEEAD